MEVNTEVRIGGERVTKKSMKTTTIQETSTVLPLLRTSSPPGARLSNLLNHWPGE